MRYLSICAILKNEARYLDEWIAFHRLQGVEHFFLYDNESDDDTFHKLYRYQDRGIANVIYIPGAAKQFEAYEDCLKNYGSSSKWIAFIDLDEFLFADALLPSFLKDYEAHAALAVHWYLYGSREQAGKLVIERFPWRDSIINEHVKSIVQPALTLPKVTNSHMFHLKTPAVNENFIELPKFYATSSPRTAKRIRINHYHTKSKAEFMVRKAMPRVSTGKVIKDVEEHFRRHNRNEVYDPFPESTIKAVKQIMSKE